MMHYRNASSGVYPITVTAATSDGRQVEDNTSVSLTVVGVVPKVILIEPPEPPDGWDPNTEYTVSAVAYSPDSGSLSYQWTLEGTTVLSTGASVTITGAEFDDVWLTVSSGAGPATTVALSDPNNSMGVFTSVPPLSTVTITESDTGGMVFEGDVATFHVHAEWTWFAGRPTVFYSTMDPSGATPTDYVSSDGPQAVAFGAATYDSDTGTWSADATIEVNTIGGIDGGGDGSVKVQLTHLFMGQFAGDGTATATIVRPEVDVSSPGSPSGAIHLGAQGTRAEVDLNALMDAAYAGKATPVCL